MLTIGMNQEAIEKALLNYISQDELNVDLSDRDVKIKLVMGRGKNGLRADIFVIPRDETATVSEPEADSPTAEAPTEAVIEPFDFEED